MDDDELATRLERPKSSGRAAARDGDATEPSVDRSNPDVAPLDPARRYELGAEIGRGGMGRVVEAKDTLLGRTVALKAALAGDREIARRFDREVRVTARLEHPAIVPVYDAGRTSDGVPYYVMRKIGGRPLDKLVNERRAVGERLALLPHVLAAVDAVAHAHARGILHRDLKPSNILVGELGETVVIDWGLAKVMGKHPSLEPDDDGPDAPGAGANDRLETRAGLVVGTPGFMAPEQLRGESANPQCDVYALGGTLYHVLAGEPPHAARSSDEMISRALAGPPRPIAETSGVPRELATIVERAMAYDASKRYPDAAALGADLRRFLTGQLVAAHQYSTLERALRFARRHRGAVAVTVVAIAALAIVGYVSVTRIVRERNAAHEAREVAEQEKQAALLARMNEAQRADDLLVSRAAGLVATNPAVAVGLLHQLPATSTSWRKARDVLAEARSRGVPWAYPASAFTSALVVLPDGSAAISAGSDGVVRHHAFATRASKELHRAKGFTRLALAEGNALAIADEASIAWWSPPYATTTAIALERPAEHLAAAGSIAIFHDGKGLWRLAKGSTEPSKIAIPTGRVRGLSVSADGKYAVVNAEPDVLVIELAAEPRVVVRRPKRSMEPAWSADGKRLAISHLQGLDEIDVSATPPTTRSIATMPNVQAAAYAGDDLYFTTGAQAYRAHPRDGVVQVPLPPATYSSATASRDAAVFVSSSGLVAVAGRGGVVTIPPIARMSLVGAHPQTGQLVVAKPGHVLHHTPLLPRSLDASLVNTTFRGFAGNAHYLIGYTDDDWRLFDVATGEARSLGRLEFGQFVGAAPDGSYVLARPSPSAPNPAPNRPRALVVLRPDRPPAPLGDATHAIALTDRHVALAIGDTLAELDVATGGKQTLWKAERGEIRAIAEHAPHVVAHTDTVLWRGDRNTGASVAAPLKPTAVDIAADGTVWFAGGRMLYRWSSDGAVVEVAQLRRPITRLVQVGGVGCVAFDDRQSPTLVDDRGVVHAFPAGYEFLSVAGSAPIAPGLSQDRRLAAYDLETRRLWTLGAGESVAAISDDGRHVATYSNGQVSIFTVELPADRAAYETLRDATTNLRVGAGDELVWPD